MLFEKCCDFYPNNFKFCAVKKNYRYDDYFPISWDLIFSETGICFCDPYFEAIYGFLTPD